jgi:XTP/dITP diphosphohydrolase
MSRVVLASHNRGKLAELGRLFAPLDMTLVGLHELGIDAPDETAPTFLENALHKARHAASRSGLPAIADDSGLVVPALGGAPGVHSARFAGEHGDDAANNRRLVAALQGISDRRAYFYCALVYLRAPDDPAPVIATAAWHGEIVDDPRGTNGFGYDPHFWLASLGRTSAELAPEKKDALSHRGQAARALLAALADGVVP